VFWFGNVLEAYFGLVKTLAEIWDLSKNWEGSLDDFFGLTTKNVGG
jgi:hypothetical protein